MSQPTKRDIARAAADERQRLHDAQRAKDGRDRALILIVREPIARRFTDGDIDDPGVILVAMDIINELDVAGALTAP
jgi:hypothetical protein